MKISANKVDAFVNNLDSSILAALVYGPDTGLVSQRAESISKHIVEDVSDPFSVVDLQSETLKDDPAKLGDEMAAISFGGGRRLIKIRNVGAGVSNIFKDALGNAPDSLSEGAFVLVTAGDLPPSSGLRKLFEAGKNIAALPCYHDDARSIRSVIAGELRKHDLSFDDDVITFMSENCRGDRMIVLSEIEKLALYAGDSGCVTIDDAIVCIGETTESSFDDVCNAVVSGDQKGLEKHLRKALQQGAQPVGILRSVQRYFQRIQSVVGQIIQQGKGQDQAIGSLRPPVFFKQMPDFKSHINIWKNRNKILWKVLETLYEGERSCKRTGVNAELMCSRSLMRVARVTRR